ncbi:hypothetical protein OH77DRAFT_1512203 [Trametes cingulata]|nr:hypothetical protein OH77DRAFT_1512203 [Trametes cingulata]
MVSDEYTGSSLQDSTGEDLQRPRLRKLPSRILSGLFGGHLKDRVRTMRRGAAQGQHNSKEGDTQVQSRQPSGPHINDLPDELFLEIFDQLHAATFCAGNIHRHTLSEWLHYIHVCTRWRYIIVSVPSFWRAIPIVRNLKALRFFVPLRGNVPLEIHFGDVQALQPQILEDLRTHLPEIRLLTVTLSSLDFQNDPLDDLLSMEMPALEELHVLPRVVLNPDARIHAPFKMQQFPRLRHLELHRLICPSDMSNLTTLHLYACVWSISFDNFIAALGRCSQLVELHLDQSLHPLHLTAPRGGSHPQKRPAYLPRLRSLIIEDYSPDLISAVLAHVTTPSIKSVRTICYATRPRRDDNGDLITSESLLRPLLPYDPFDIQLAVNSAPATARISTREDMCTLTVTSTEGHCSSNISVSGRFDREWTHVVPSAMHDLADVFSGAKITALVIQASSYYILPTDWKKLFNALPSLDTLDLTSSGTWTAMWQGLHRAGLLAATPEVVGCPQLATVRIRHISRPEDNYPAPPDENDLQVIKDTLRWRALHGARLKHLSWSMCSSEHAGYDVARKRFLDELGPFVDGTVAYEDLSAVQQPELGR